MIDFQTYECINKIDTVDSNQIGFLGPGGSARMLHHLWGIHRFRLKAVRVKVGIR